MLAKVSNIINYLKAGPPFMRRSDNSRLQGQSGTGGIYCPGCP